MSSSSVAAAAAAVAAKGQRNVLDVEMSIADFIQL
jgi:hypothetical protein